MLVALSKLVAKVRRDARFDSTGADRDQEQTDKESRAGIFNR